MKEKKEVALYLFIEGIFYSYSLQLDHVNSNYVLLKISSVLEQEQ